ncbi:translocation/assembly module TamB domain-containing protein [Sphingomonas sanxanigenens]|uniref:Translocation and assembly module TamB C-terminal domain-containing protein n=1 Tax=Sphingomonas sanxanigenens DSM 19645 = NX02 TaxID=1123269 RepID=W0A8D3_9SPHN|nr:translocation/assembly module TamB domain-containing protein [Sphingomonas sanxanigenens]AHE53361.1 hypothetical protein NX02_08185 [Sphingomonas sanxanigenens DSM 19645 = NX02]
MSGEDLLPPPDPAPAQRSRRGLFGWLWRLLLILVGFVAISLWLIDTGPGHRLIIDGIARIETPTGLRFRVGRIDGSIYRRATLREVKILDPKGVVFSTPEARLDWRPTKWLANRLEIRSLTMAQATLHKLPELRRTGRAGPILPGFDIRIGALRVDRLRIAAGVAGPARTGRLAGTADVRSGRAMVRLNATIGRGDRLNLVLDAEPDRDRFDLDARLAAEAGGVFGKLLGTDRTVAARIVGDGRWTAWQGRALVDMSAMRVIDLSLGVREGAYSLSGSLYPSRVSQGKLMRLSAPRILVDGMATLAARRLDGRLALRSQAVVVETEGRVDLGAGAYDDLRIDIRLLRPSALFPNMTGRDVRGRLRLDGPFATARFDYLLTAPRLAFDNTGFETVRAEGRGRLSPAPIAVPIKLSARRVTGVGDVAGGILANLRVEGLLKLTAKALTGDGLRVRSDKLNGKLSLFVDLITGRYDVGLAGGLTSYLIPGLGVVDVKTELKVVPGPGGRGTMVVGRGQAWVRRFDNMFLRSLAGGLPYLDTRLERGPDRVLHFKGLKLTAPELRLTGNGYRRVDGSFFFEGGGEQARYGPVKLTLDGRIERPKLDIFLPKPLDALGLADVRLLLDPTAQGFDYRAAGGSTLGPFTSNGQILLPSGEPAVIRVADVTVSGTHGRGDIRSDPGGFTGRIDLTGGGVSGPLLFGVERELQRIEMQLRVEDARFAGPPAISIRRGNANIVFLLDPDGISIKGSATARGLRRGGVSLARFAGTADLKGGSGTVTAAFAGSRGRAFDIQTSARVSPDRIELSGQGTVDRRPIALKRPAVLTPEDGGWRVAEAALAFSGGDATLSGLFGATRTEVEAKLTRMPMTVLDIGYPGLGLGGYASGSLSYRQAEGGQPSGRADLTIRGLNRSGLVLSSRPIDVGVAAVLTGGSAGVRAVAASGGRTIGRAQARLAPLPGSGDLFTRLSSAPLFAQLRYDGAADTLWRLTGVESFDLSGPVAVAADVHGTFDNPRIDGSVRTTGARLESPVTGTVVSNIQATGRFNGSQLVLDRFTGVAGQGGTVTGTGAFDFAAANGLGIALDLQANHAVLLNRDDIGATITGPLRILSDGAGGTVSGNVAIDRGRFRLGRAVAAEAVPRLKVTELNRAGEEIERAAPPAPWNLDVHATARNRLMVTGLGLDSEWRADLDIKGEATAPAIGGRADLVEGGYEFSGRRFDLERGSIRFTGSVPADPVLDIVAIADIQGLNASIRVSGTGQKPDIAFTSTPALPEDELLSRLLFGTSITNLSAPEALQLAAAVASLQGGGTGLNPINAVRQAVGLDRLRILPADVTTGQGTSVAAGKYLTRRTFVEVITDGQGYSATRVEFQVTRWLSLLSSISTIGRQSVNVRVSKDY